MNRKKESKDNSKSIKFSWNTKCKLCIALSFAGTLAFFIIPYIRVLYYSFIDNQFNRRFVGFMNYIETIKNTYFLLAFKNSLLIILLCVQS